VAGSLTPAVAGQLQRARRHYQQGQYAQCIKVCEALLRVSPSSQEALTLCGSAHLKSGHAKQATECLKRRFALDSSDAQVAEDIATLLMHENQFKEAITYLDYCISLRGWTEELGYNCGFCHQEVGQRAEALAAYQQVISQNPRMLEAYLRTALLLHDMGQFNEAIELLDFALTLNPDSPLLVHCQAKLLIYQGRLSTALQKFEQLEAISNLQIEHIIDYAELLTRMKRVDAAKEKFLRVLELDPDHRRGLTCYASLLFSLKQHEEALELIERVIKKYPNDCSSLVNMGSIYGAQRNFIKAQEYFARAYAVNPRGGEVAGAYLYSKSFVCDWRDHAEILSVIEHDLEYTTSRAFPSVLYENNPRANLAYARVSIQRKYPSTHILGDVKTYAKKDKIRIGYYSSDFYHHATVMLLEGMLREHDRSRFELYAFSLDFSKQDGYTDRVRQLFDHYHDVSRLSDGAVTLLSRRLEIDIAIDLKGFTEGSRTAIFAERAAPVQINYLGFPGSMGAPYIDYMVADHYAIKPSMRPYFDEKIIYMPDCYQPNNPARPSPGHGSQRPAELPESKFVFCSFNNTHKLTPKVFDLWLRILDQAPDSVLWMLKSTEQAQANLLDYIKASGMDPSRVVFAPMLMEADHLKRFVHADLFMDSFPCNAHTTASDALWAGVPLITRSGETFASRVAGSILHAVGLEELIVETEADYEALALRIYRDRAYHRQLKQRVRDGVEHGALYDAKKYTRAFEQALVEVYERHHRGEAPQDLEVASLSAQTETLGAA
jgi:predicted O-linked N-acetylglucosamine transferase (SPINDLY family)